MLVILNVTSTWFQSFFSVKINESFSIIVVHIEIVISGTIMMIHTSVFFNHTVSFLWLYFIGVKQTEREMTVFFIHTVESMWCRVKLCAVTSRILFFCPSLTLPARQQWARAFWMMCLLDLALGSLYSFGPEWEQRGKQHQDETVVMATPPVISKKRLVPSLFFTLSFDESCMKIFGDASYKCMHLYYSLSLDKN